MNGTERRRIARHEGCHLGMAFVAAADIERAWVAEPWRIVRAGETDGYVKLDFGVGLAERLLIALAAPAWFSWDDPHCESDMALARSIADLLPPGSMEFAQGLADRIVHTLPFCSLVSAVGIFLNSKGSVSGSEVQSLLEEVWQAQELHGRRLLEGLAKGPPIPARARTATRELSRWSR